MTKDWVQGVGHSPVCQILMQIVVRAVITSSPPAWASSAAMLSTPTDFPFFSECTAASTYIPVRKRFRSGVNIARTRSFPGADTGNDHDLLIMTSHLHLKRVNTQKHTRLEFDLEKLKYPSVLETFKAMICGKFAPLTIMNSEDTDMDSMITTFNTAVTETASGILGKHRPKKNPGSLQKFLICATKEEN